MLCSLAGTNGRHAPKVVKPKQETNSGAEGVRGVGRSDVEAAGNQTTPLLLSLLGRRAREDKKQTK